MVHLPLPIPGQKTAVSIRPQVNPVAVARPLALMVRSPSDCWRKLRNNGKKFHTVFAEQVFLLALLPSAFGFVGFCLVGEVDWVVGAKKAVLGYLASILFLYAAAVFAHKTAEALAGRDSIDVSGKLAVYSLMPFFVASFFLIHPVMAPLVMFGAFGAWQFFHGACEMTDVPANRLLLYCSINIVAWIVVVDRLLVALFSYR